MLLLSRDYTNSTAGTKRQFVLSNPLTDGPFSDRYWLVRYCSVFVSDTVIEDLALYLLTGQAYTQVLQQTVNLGDAYKVDFVTSGAVTPPPIAGIHKIAPGSGTNVGQWLMTAQWNAGFGMTCNNTGYPDIIIPSGFALYCLETTASVSASARNITMRLAYQEIMNRCSPDAAW